MTNWVKSDQMFKSAAVRAGAGALYYSGALRILRARTPETSEARVPPFAVLLYHRVNPDDDPFFPAVSVKSFEMQMRYLAKNFQVRSLTYILDRIQAGAHLEPWTVAITFDDGYRDNYLYAHPILRKYRLPATIFAATGYIGNGRMMWNDRVAAAIKHTGRNRFTLALPSKNIVLSLESDRNKLASLGLVLEELKNLPERDKNSLLEHCLESLRYEKNKLAGPMLSWPELMELANAGWEVGSHTEGHKILTKISELEALSELAKSKEALEGRLQRPISFFAYPNGKDSDFNSTTRKLVQQSSYRAAFTTVSGFNQGNLDVFALRRLSPWEQNLSRFAMTMEWTFWLEQNKKPLHQFQRSPL